MLNYIRINKSVTAEPDSSYFGVHTQLLVFRKQRLQNRGPEMPWTTQNIQIRIMTFYAWHMEIGRPDLTSHLLVKTQRRISQFSTVAL